MRDDFVDVILAAVEAMGKPDDLRIESDDLSTLVVGSPERVISAVSTAYEAACRAGGHVVLQALFSRGCPGEPDDPLCTLHAAAGEGTASGRGDAPGQGTASGRAVGALAGHRPESASGQTADRDARLSPGSASLRAPARPAGDRPRSASTAATGTARPASGIEIDAQFSLYPLGEPGYMETIAAAIEGTKTAGVFDRSKHFCTRLTGDVASVFAAVERSFVQSGPETAHVVVHLTVSAGSPSKTQKTGGTV